MIAFVLRYLPQILMAGGAAVVLGAAGTALTRWHWELARKEPMAELAALQLSIDTAAETARLREQAARLAVEEKERANRTAVAGMLAGLEKSAADRERDSDARIGRLRNELEAARAFNRHRDALSSAGANPAPCAAGPADPGADRGRHPVADPVLDSADGITRRYIALSEAYAGLLALGEAGVCINITKDTQ